MVDLATMTAARLSPTPDVLANLERARAAAAGRRP